MFSNVAVYALVGVGTGRKCQTVEYGPTVEMLMKATLVEVASLTSVAARQINGKTLHSFFQLLLKMVLL